MNESSKNYKMKFIHVMRVLITLSALCLIGIGMWRFVEADSSKQLSSLFSIIWGTAWLINMYKLSKELKTNNNKISFFRMECYFFQLGRAILVSLVYFYIVVGDFWNSILISIATLLIISVEIFIRRREAKKNIKVS